MSKTKAQQPNAPSRPRLSAVLRVPIILCFLFPVSGIAPMGNTRVVAAATQDSLTNPDDEQTVSSNRAFRREQREAAALRLRMQSIGWCCAGMLSVLFVALVYFRLNHATRGIYSRRLLLFAILISSLLVMACALCLGFLWR